MGAIFPLTPALSLVERENRPPLRGESNALGRVGVSALNRGAHAASESDARLKQDAGCSFPAHEPRFKGARRAKSSGWSLPAVESQGEGERAAADPSADYSNGFFWGMPFGPSGSGGSARRIFTSSGVTSRPAFPNEL